MVGDDEPTSTGGAVSVRIESSYVINLRDLDMKHVKDFTFVHGKQNYVHQFVMNIRLGHIEP